MLAYKLTEDDKEKCKREIDSIVSTFRDEYDIPIPIPNSFKLLEESIGIFIISKKINNDISAFQYKIGNNKFIFINNSHDLGRQYFSLWHEVYHLYTGDGVNIKNNLSKEYMISEKKADLFASRILIEKNELRSLIQNNKNYIKQGKLDIQDFIKLQSYFKVSYQSLVYRIKEEFPNLFDNDYFNEVFTLGSLDNRSELMKITESLGFDNDINAFPKENYISPIIFQYLNENLNENINSVNRTQDLLSYITEELDLNIE